MQMLLKNFSDFNYKALNNKVVIFGAGTIGRLTDLALRKNGIESQLFVDSDPRKQGKEVQNKKIISPDDLKRYDTENTHVFIACNYFSSIVPFLKKNKFKNFYKVTDVLKKIDVYKLYNEIDMDMLFSKLLPLKLERNLAFYNEMCNKEDYVTNNKLVLKSIDVQITEKCSLKCKDCSNLMQYYKKPVDSDYDLLVSCTGLQADITYKNLTKTKRPLKIVPFRGEYYKLNDSAKKLVNHLIYPVGNPKYPFLGVHFTRIINGDREVGPNAVLALKREGYKNLDISINDIMDYITYPGFLNFIRKNFFFSLNEFSTSIFKTSFLKKAKKLIPDIRINDIEKGPAGVRAQPIENNGELVMDFKIQRHNNQIHILNAQSPAATSSLAFADYVIENYINK